MDFVPVMNIRADVDKAVVTVAFACGVECEADLFYKEGLTFSTEQMYGSGKSNRIPKCSYNGGIVLQYALHDKEIFHTGR